MNAKLIRTCEVIMLGIFSVLTLVSLVFAFSVWNKDRDYVIFVNEAGY